MFEIKKIYIFSILILSVLFVCSGVIAEGEKPEFDWAFPDSKFNRNEIPSYNQVDFTSYKVGRGTCTINAAVNPLIWWTNIGLLKKPEGDGDLPQIITETLMKYTQSGKREAFSVELLQRALKRYLDEHNISNCTFYFKNMDISRQSLYFATRNGACSVLILDAIRPGKDGKPDYNREVIPHAVSLVDFNPKTNVVKYNTWGKTFEHDMNSYIRAEKNRIFNISTFSGEILSVFPVRKKLKVQINNIKTK